MELRGTGCVVRSWRSTDALSLVRHANNRNIARHLRDRFPHPYTRSDAQAFLRQRASGTGATDLAIEVDGAAAGGVGVSRGSDIERYSAEIGYWLGQEFWGRGIVTEAVLLVTEYVFAHMDLLRLYALPFADNAPSIRVLEKAGYTREGLLRSSAVKDGQPRDQVLYARLNGAWRGVPSGGDGA